MEFVSPDTDHEWRINFRFEFNRESDGRTEIVEFVTDVSDKEMAKEMAERELTERLGEDVDNWEVAKTGVGFHDPPWQGSDDIATEFRELSGVKSARYEGPFNGFYTPARVIIDTDDAQQAVESIGEYYPPLRVEESGGRVIVYTSPVKSMLD